MYGSFAVWQYFSAFVITHELSIACTIEHNIIKAELTIIIAICISLHLLFIYQFVRLADVWFRFNLCVLVRALRGKKIMYFKFWNVDKAVT